MQSLSWKPGKILVATDFSEPSDAALEQAVWLSEKSGAPVTLTHVLTDIRQAMVEMSPAARWELVAGDIDVFERSLRQRADEKLKQLASQHSTSSVQLRYQTLLGVPYVEIIHAVQKEGFDMVVAGTRGQSGLQRLLIGSSAERLVRQCPCPVWIAKRRQPDPMQAILVAVDFSDAARRVLEIGASLAALAGARLEVMHAMFLPAEESIKTLEMTSEWKSGGIRRQRQAIDRSIRQRLTDLVKAHVPDGLGVQVRTSRGEPWKVITGAARRYNVDLVVMGTMARAGIPGFFLGSTAERVLRTCDRSIVTVQPDGFVSSIQPPSWSLHPADAPSNP